MTDFDFTANQAVDNLDGVPEKYRGLYHEGEGDNAGRFTLSQAAQGLVTDYVGLAKNAAGLRQEKKSVTDENAQRRLAVKGIEDTLTGLGVEIGEEGAAAAIQAFVSDLQDKVKNGQAVKVDMDKLKAQFEKQVADVKADAQGDVDGMMGALRKHMITGAAKAAIAENKGSVDLLLPHVESQCDVVKDDSGDFVVRVKDPDGTYRINGAGSFMGVGDLVTEMKSKDAFGRAFESETKGGNDTRPGSLNIPAPKTNRELSSVEKISAGLKKQQHGRGFGAGQ